MTITELILKAQPAFCSGCSGTEGPTLEGESGSLDFGTVLTQFAYMTLGLTLYLYEVSSPDHWLSNFLTMIQ